MDTSTYENFVRSMWPQAVRTCWLILRNRQDAEEAAQDAFVSLYRHVESVRELEKLQAWFYKVLMNAARQRRRRVKTHAELGEREVADATDRIGEADLRITVQAAMERLSEDERIAAVLCYYAGLTDREAAKAAGWTLGTYKWRLAKARRRLGDLLKEEKPMGYLLSEEMVGNG